MADYYPLLMRALDGLPDPAPEARRRVYERARAALIAQLRSLNPPVAEAEILRECLSLDDAVQRIEQTYAEMHAPAPEHPPYNPDEQEYSYAYVDHGPVPVEEPHRQWDEASPDDLQIQDHATQPQPESVAAERRGGRPRVVVQPPTARKGARKRGVILFTTILCVVAVIAGLALWLKHKEASQSEDARPPVETTQQTPTDAPPKTTESVNGGVVPPVSTSTQHNSPGFFQEAKLIEQMVMPPPNNIKIIDGGASWKLDAVSVGEGKPLETVIRGHAEFPEAKFAVDLVIRRNTDSTLPATHTITISVSGESSHETRAVKTFGALTVKDQPNALSPPLRGVMMPLTETASLLALYNTPQDSKANMELLRTRDWFDLPLTYMSNQNALVVFEKGTEGRRVFDEAFRDWSAASR